MSYQSIMDERAKLVEKAKDLLAKPEAEGRDGLTGEEKTEYQRMRDDIDALLDKAKSAKEYETLRADAATLDQEDNRPDWNENYLVAPEPLKRKSYLPESSTLRPSVNRAVKTFLRGADYEHSKEDVENLRLFNARPGSNILKLRLPQRRARNLDEAYRRLDALKYGEIRGTDPQKVGTAEHGGYAVPAEIMAAQLDVELLSHGGIYPYARKVRTMSGTSLALPGVDDTTVKAVIVGEGDTTAVSDVTLTDKSITTYKYSSGVQKISLELLQDSAFDITGLIGELIGLRFARGLNEHWTVGNGTSKPVGIFQTTVAAAGDSGVAQAAANAWTYGNIIDLVYSVDSEYRKSPSCVFQTRDNEIGKLKKIVDSQNRPIFLPNLEVGGIPLFEGFPIVANPDMPSGSSALGLGFGDLSRYVIREVMDIELHTLNELYLPDGYIGMVAFGRWGGGPVGSTANAIKYATEHASST